MVFVTNVFQKKDCNMNNLLYKIFIIATLILSLNYTTSYAMQAQQAQKDVAEVFVYWFSEQIVNPKYVHYEYRENEDEYVLRKWQIIDYIDIKSNGCVSQTCEALKAFEVRGFADAQNILFNLMLFQGWLKILSEKNSVVGGYKYKYHGWVADSMLQKLNEFMTRVREVFNK